MTLPASGAITLSAINTEFGGRGTNLNAYRGTTYWVEGNPSTFNFAAGSLSFSDFYSKRGTSPATSGSFTSSTAGSSTFTVPVCNYITVTVEGGTGGGGSCGVTYGGPIVNDGTLKAGDGGATTFSGPTTLTANGGQGGGSWPYTTSYGAPGTASGGDTNTTGGSTAAGGIGNNYIGYKGQDGGRGGLSSKTFYYGTITPGQVINYTIGAAGTGTGSGFSGAVGVAGKITITWG